MKEEKKSYEWNNNQTDGKKPEGKREGGKKRGRNSGTCRGGEKPKPHLAAANATALRRSVPCRHPA